MAAGILSAFSDQHQGRPTGRIDQAETRKSACRGGQGENLLAARTARRNSQSVLDGREQGLSIGQHRHQRVVFAIGLVETSWILDFVS